MSGLAALSTAFHEKKCRAHSSDGIKTHSIRMGWEGKCEENQKPIERQGGPKKLTG
jgi:hypothetical protein